MVAECEKNRGKVAKLGEPGKKTSTLGLVCDGLDRVNKVAGEGNKVGFLDFGLMRDGVEGAVSDFGAKMKVA